MSRQNIPVRNIYYLLSYAWEFIDQGEEDFLTSDTFENPTDMLGKIFDVCLSVLARRGYEKQLT